MNFRFVERMDEVLKLARLPPIPETLADHQAAPETMMTPAAVREERISAG